MPRALEARDEAYISARVEPDPNSGCWLWNRKLGSTGYGNSTRGGPRTPQISAHRLSWEIHRGPIPKGFHVLHKCDVKGCVNPDHLFVGRHRDNMADCALKGRLTDHRGELNPFALLKPTQVIAIRASNLPVKMLAALCGCSQPTIRRIIRRETWGDT